MITLDEFVDCWEQGTGNALIDTMGVLNGGKIFFITCPLPDTDILGRRDQAQPVGCPLQRRRNRRLLPDHGTRWVCQNTLLGSLAREADAVFRVAHDTDIMGNLIGWMQNAYGTALDKAAAVKEALEIMARRPLTQTEAIETVKMTVPLPREPRPTGSPNDDVRLRENWGRACDKVVKERATILNLYEGAGLGMETPAANHTAFGLLQRVSGRLTSTSSPPRTTRYRPAPTCSANAGSSCSAVSIICCASAGTKGRMIGTEQMPHCPDCQGPMALRRPIRKDSPPEYYCPECDEQTRPGCESAGTGSRERPAHGGHGRSILQRRRLGACAMGSVTADDLKKLDRPAWTALVEQVKADHPIDSVIEHTGAGVPPGP